MIDHEIKILEKQPKAEILQQEMNKNAKIIR